MPSRPVGDMTYTGTISELFPNNPYAFYGVSIPDFGGVPYKPQSENEILEPRNIDGARYRVGGWHFPKFNLTAILAASDFSSALSLARELEMLKGDSVNVRFPIIDTRPLIGYNCWVIDVRAAASAAQVLGAETKYVPDPTVSGPPGANTTGMVASGASVNAVFTLQVFIP